MIVTRIRNARGRAAGYGGCYRCGDTWDYKTSHTTTYRDGRGCFPLCEECWAALTPDERLPYYEELWGEWTRQFSMIRDDEVRAEVAKDYGPDEYAAIVAAVKAGL